MPVETGNTLPRPPRLTGDKDGDRMVLNKWMQDLYNTLVLSANVTGTLADHETRITNLEARVTELEGP